MENLTMTIILLIAHDMCCQSHHWPLRATIVQVLLSNSAYFPPFLTMILSCLESTQRQTQMYYIQYLSGSSVLQDTTDNNTSVCIILFRNLSKPNFFRPVKESWIRIISYLFPMWVNLILCILCLTRYFFINRFSGLRIVRVNVKLPSKYIPLLDGLYSPFSDEKNLVFVWHRF